MWSQVISFIQPHIFLEQKLFLIDFLINRLAISPHNGGVILQAFFFGSFSLTFHKYPLPFYRKTKYRLCPLVTWNLLKSSVIMELFAYIHNILLNSAVHWGHYVVFIVYCFYLDIFHLLLAQWYRLKDNCHGIIGNWLELGMAWWDGKSF